MKPTVRVSLLNLSQIASSKKQLSTKDKQKRRLTSADKVMEGCKWVELL